MKINERKRRGRKKLFFSGFLCGKCRRAVFMADREESIGMLSEVYRAAEMGIEGTELLIGKSEDSRFSERLRSYVNRYGGVKDEAARLLSQYGAVPKNARPRADPACTALEDKFLNLQQEYTEDMKKFLV